jgi:hypothetical protein
MGGEVFTVDGHLLSFLPCFFGIASMAEVEGIAEGATGVGAEKLHPCHSTEGMIDASSWLDPWWW